MIWVDDRTEGELYNERKVDVLKVLTSNGFEEISNECAEGPKTLGGSLIKN